MVGVLLSDYGHCRFGPPNLYNNVFGGNKFAFWSVQQEIVCRPWWQQVSVPLCRHLHLVRG